MEVLAPKSLGYVGTGGHQRRPSVQLERASMAPEEYPFASQLRADMPAHPQQPGKFDPIQVLFDANSVEGRNDNLPRLRTVFKDPKYEMRPELSNAFNYDGMNRGNNELENQWYYSTLTRTDDTPLSMGYLPEYRRSSGVTLRDPDTPDMLKPSKRELMAEEVFVAQPEPDRRFMQPILMNQAMRARNESKYAGGEGALNGFYTNDHPGNLGGPWKGWSTGLEPTRQFTGYHPRQRFYRADDNLSKRGRHGLRAGLTSDNGRSDVRSELGGFKTFGKKDQTSTYHRIAVADGGRAKPHLPDDMQAVQLRYTAREGAAPSTTMLRHFDDE